MEDLECLLLLTPSLVHLKLVSSRSTLDSIFIGSYWEQFIQNNLLSLNKFQFFLTCNTDKFNDTNTLDSLILPFQTSFWLNDNHWFVICDYTLRESKIKLYTTPVCQNIGTRSPRFEVSSTNSKCRLILDSNEDVLYNTTGEVSWNVFLI
jgi:hypothetical protein